MTREICGGDVGDSLCIDVDDLGDGLIFETGRKGREEKIRTHTTTLQLPLRCDERCHGGQARGDG
jgi:hypothetical protein